ncbi:MAG: hypothetical protein D6785_02845 [Planctomycetota bacterium]|nr:MAG: hypothetical protein D6785_02845 [Planctomycetota bacterium]
MHKQAKQAGEIRSRWEWVESSIWTDAKLTALETGVKGGVWFRWSNAFFAERGLFSLMAAYESAGQFSRR